MKRIGFQIHIQQQQMIEHFQLIQQADLSYPIILSADGRVDGMHRVAKAKLLDHLTIKAVRFEVRHQQILSILTRMIWINAD